MRAVHDLGGTLCDGLPFGFCCACFTPCFCIAMSRMQLALAAFAWCCSMLHQRWHLCVKIFKLQSLFGKYVVALVMTGTIAPRLSA